MNDIRTRGRLLAALQAGEQMTGRSAAERFGVTYNTAALILGQLRADGLAHVCAWLRPPAHSGPCIRVFAAGAAPDAPRPAPLANLERVRRYQQTAKGKAAMRRAILKAVKRRKTDVEYKMSKKAIDARYWDRKRSVKPVGVRDPLLAALMGAPKC